MSRAGVPRALFAIVALLAVASLVSCATGVQQPSSKQGGVQSVESLVAVLDAVAPDVDSIRINFSCDTVDSIALKAPNGRSAWSVRRRRNDSISWVVPSNVTINSIGGALPLDSAGPQGGAPGTPYKSKVKDNAERKTYHYIIDATCQPAAAPARRLIIDPEFIVHP